MLSVQSLSVSIVWDEIDHQPKIRLLLSNLESPLPTQSCMQATSLKWNVQELLLIDRGARVCTRAKRVYNTGMPPRLCLLAELEYIPQNVTLLLAGLNLNGHILTKINLGVKALQDFGWFLGRKSVFPNWLY